MPRRGARPPGERARASAVRSARGAAAPLLALEAAPSSSLCGRAGGPRGREISRDPIQSHQGLYGLGGGAGVFTCWRCAPLPCPVRMQAVGRGGAQRAAGCAAGDAAAHRGGGGAAPARAGRRGGAAQAAVPPWEGEPRREWSWLGLAFLLEGVGRSWEGVGKELGRRWLACACPLAQVLLFGSAANGLCVSRTNDIDVCLDLGPAFDNQLEKSEAVAQLGVLLQDASMEQVVALPKVRRESRGRAQTRPEGCRQAGVPPATGAGAAQLHARPPFCA